MLKPLVLKLNLPDTLNNISIERIAIKLRPAAEKKIKQEQHPWIFDESIEKQNKKGKSGDLAIVFDKRKNSFLACGLYDADSPIRIKLLQFNQASTINESWFKKVIANAYELRKPLLTTDTNAYRLLFGENDSMPGFIADVYDDTVVLKIYSSIWFPYLKLILPIIITQTNANVLLLRFSRNVTKSANKIGLHDGDVIYGHLVDENIIVKEHGIKFKVNVRKGHKTGFFLDHRHNRLAIGKLAESKEVLDVFSYAGGFSVHCVVGGAKTVTSLDISEQALSLASSNVKLNSANANLKLVRGDAFKQLDLMILNAQKFDIVIIDPPAFAKQASEIDRALDSYAKLAKLGSQLVKKGGTLILASCSSRVSADKFFETNERALYGSGLQLFRKTFHDIDHPIGFKEGAYLKTGFYRLTKTKVP